MNTSSTPSHASAVRGLPILQDILLGLKVLGSELKWLIIALLRNWEIAQLRKRLHQEYRALGVIEAVGAGLEQAMDDRETNIFDEKELALKQIAFLLDEIRYLRDRLGEERKEYIQRRVNKWFEQDIR